MSAVHQAHLLTLLGPHTRRHVMQLLARHPGITVTSTLRTPERNRAVGGVQGSLHLEGRAADFSGSRDALVAAFHDAKRLRVGPRCTGPEEVLIHDAGTGIHLHAAW
jgi:Ser/Thr protein kinase RdoA (MazF antagonist)